MVVAGIRKTTDGNCFVITVVIVNDVVGADGVESRVNKNRRRASPWAVQICGAASDLGGVVVKKHKGENNKAGRRARGISAGVTSYNGTCT